MTRTKPWSSLAGMSALCLALLGVVVTPARAGAPVIIDIATVNDFHGRIATAPGLACMVNSMRTANPNSMFVSAGDLIGATTFESAVANDVPTINVMNAMGLEVSALGNHEFDKGQTSLNKDVIPAAKWTYLGANIVKNTAPAYDPYKVITKSGVRVAFIGAMTPELPSLVSPSGIAGLSVTSMVDSVNHYVNQLSDGNDANGEADVFIVVVHDGSATADQASAAGTAYGALLAGVNPKVSAILSGHTHQLYTYKTPNGVQVLQTKAYGEFLGRLSIAYDPDTKTAAVTRAENLPTVKDCADPAVKAIVDAANANADVLGAVPLGAIAKDFLRANGGSDRGSESTLNNFIADVQKWAAKDAGAQIAFMNPGGIRADLLYRASGKEGDAVVTFKEAAVVQPFANTLMVANLTGAQIKAVLEEQWQPEGASRPVLKLGQSANVWYSFDPTMAKGSRITEIKIDGKPIDMAGSYKVVANSFLMDGGDNFTTFTKATNKADAGWVDLDALVQYFRKVSAVGTATPATPDYKQRSVAVTYLTDPQKVYTQGEVFAMNLASLSMTNPAEPKPTKVTAMLGTLVLGTFNVDNTLDGQDLMGKAQVRLTITDQMLAFAPKAPLVFVDDTGPIHAMTIKLAAPTPPTPPRPLPTTGGSAPIGAVLVLLALIGTALMVRNRIVKA